LQPSGCRGQGKYKILRRKGGRNRSFRRRVRSRRGDNMDADVNDPHHHLYTDTG